MRADNIENMNAILLGGCGELMELEQAHRYLSFIRHPRASAAFLPFFHHQISPQASCKSILAEFMSRQEAGGKNFFDWIIGKIGEQRLPKTGAE